MKKFTLLLVLLVSLSVFSFAKKDLNAWKNENSLEKQYEVFKTNLNFWNGSYFMKPIQMDEFYRALTDSVAALENIVSNNQNQISLLQEELTAQTAETNQIQQKLDDSIKHQNAVGVFGLQLHKSFYTAIISSIILGLLVVLTIVFVMFRRSNMVTIRTKKDYDELKEEFETHKKNSLERYTKINMELHKTRLEFNKR
ncbi:MAG: hypothetical protein ABFS16_05885 [Bacteroidota bacterium]